MNDAQLAEFIHLKQYWPRYAHLGLLGERKAETEVRNSVKDKKIDVTSVRGM